MTGQYEHDHPTVSHTITVHRIGNEPILKVLLDPNHEKKFFSCFFTAYSLAQVALKLKTSC